MKVDSSSKISIYRLAVLLLLLVSCFPLTLLTDTGAEGSNFRGTLPQRTRDIIEGGQLKNCRVTSTTPPAQGGYVQQCVSTMVMDIDDAGLVAGVCETSFTDPKNTGVNIQTTFQTKGNYNLSSITGTFALGYNMSGKGGALNSRANGNFKSTSIVRALTNGDSVNIHFTVTEWYLLGADGKKYPEEGENGLSAFDATFDAVGFLGDTPPPAATPASAIATPTGAQLSSLSGEVEYLPPGADSISGWKFAKMDTKFVPGSHIRTGVDSNCIVSFADLSTFMVKPDSEIIIAEPKAEQSALEMVNGNVWINFKRMTAGEGLEVKTSQAVTGIKGTTLVCETTATSSTVKVIEGNVEVTSKSNGQKVSVEGGKMITATQSGLGAKTSFDTTAEQADWDKIKNSATPITTKSATIPSSTKSSAPQISLGPLKLPHLKVGPLSCFIATAAYGSQTAEQLDTLRAFRDKVLLKSEAGAWFVETYYFLSPPPADFIADKDWLRAIVRFELLDPIVFILQNSQQLWNN